jgi:hypothetical protein
MAIIFVKDPIAVLRPSMKQITSLAIIVFIATSLSACSESTEPNVSPAVEMTLVTTVENVGGNSFIRAKSSVSNVGDVTVFYPINCGYFVGISLKDEDGVRLTLRDPELIPACPPGFNPLVPGETIQGGLDILWAWDENGEKYLIPGGNYTIETSFGYHVGTNDDPVIIVDAEMSLVL